MFSKRIFHGNTPSISQPRASEVSKASRLALAVAGPIYRYLFRARYPTRYGAHPRKTLDGVKHTCAHRVCGNGVRNEVNGTKRRREIGARTFLLFSTLLASRETRRDRAKIGGAVESTKNEWEDSTGASKFNNQNNLRVNMRTNLVADPDTSWENASKHSYVATRCRFVIRNNRPILDAFDVWSTTGQQVGWLVENKGGETFYGKRLFCTRELERLQRMEINRCAAMVITAILSIMY